MHIDLSDEWKLQRAVLAPGVGDEAVTRYARSQGWGMRWSAPATDRCPIQTQWVTREPRPQPGEHDESALVSISQIEYDLIGLGGLHILEVRSRSLEAVNAVLDAFDRDDGLPTVGGAGAFVEFDEAVTEDEYRQAVGLLALTAPVRFDARWGSRLDAASRNPLWRVRAAALNAAALVAWPELRPLQERLAGDACPSIAAAAEGQLAPPAENHAGGR